MSRRRTVATLMMLACLTTTGSLDAYAKKPKKQDAPPLCPASFNDSLETNGIAPKANPETGIKPPKLLSRTEAEMSDEARRGYRDGSIRQKDFVSTIKLVVGKNGLPSEVCVATAAGYGLDAQAGNAVKQYRFDPATKDGQPIALRLTVEVSFHFI